MAAPRESRLSARTYVFERFQIDVSICQLTRDGQIVALPPKAFDTLLILVRHRDRIVTKEELIQAVWPNAFVSDDNLTQNIWAIRRALSDDSNQPRFIATVPRRGYRFVAAVTEVEQHGEPVPA